MKSAIIVKTEDTRVYPKFNGKQFDELRKKDFDYWRQTFTHALKDDTRVLGLSLTNDQIETLAHNLAFYAVTTPLK